MIPIEKIKDIITKHDALEKELSSAIIDPKQFAKKSLSNTTDNVNAKEMFKDLFGDK